MSYEQKKAQLSKILTIYGRKPVEEALLSPSINAYKLHLADSNRPAAILQHCIELAEKQNVSIVYHDKRSLSFISKNAKQDQGIALDIMMDNLYSMKDLAHQKPKYLIMLDNVTNPQNTGMVIRSVAAGFVDGLIIPQKGCADIGPLTIKASTGSLFRAPIYRCESTEEALHALKGNFRIASLSLNASDDFYQLSLNEPTVFILGNESQGISKASQNASDMHIKIPMNNGVESLNVAITAALIAYHPALAS